MSLTLIAVPIGNMGDITLRALDSLKEAELFIGEERKPMFRLLKVLGIDTPQNFELLNEHSTAAEINDLAKKCKHKPTVLLTDCGTPGFSDPGAALVKACRELGISVTSNPGASSLTTFRSLCGVRLTQFDFLGFPPRESQLRNEFFQNLSRSQTPTIIMDTPYRLQKCLQELSTLAPKKNMVLGIDLTRGDEEFFSGTTLEVSRQCKDNKREFMILIH